MTVCSFAYRNIIQFSIRFIFIEKKKIILSLYKLSTSKSFRKYHRKMSIHAIPAHCASLCIHVHVNHAQEAGIARLVQRVGLSGNSVSIPGRDKESALGSNHPPIPLVSVSVSLMEKWLLCADDHKPSSSAVVKGGVENLGPHMIS